ncbi:TonB-dependent receptor [Roseibium litorale]|uniref:TonB-dependent receptor n=1 Tax=Roseibium litorale TaxID=2803841 RepID=A0ABR9CRK5_9HYPH|nr:TonB-dependent receptor [Roseibium litorale]MBD8893279.1 TonB-dependent receptor [Roseibium litorale]
MHIRTLALTTTALLSALPALAQDGSDTRTATTLDQIVVTAGRNEAEISTLAQSVVVIDQEQIENANFGSTDAADLIARLVPGFAPSNQTLSGASETFRGRDVLIMVDGVPRNTPLRDNSRILSMIDLSTIERIEVVNGSSSLYGAGATGGTINFITKRGLEDGIRTTITTGVSAYTQDIGNSIAPQVSANVEGRIRQFDYFFSVSGDMTRKAYDGQGREMASDAMLGQGGADRTKQGNLFTKLGYENEGRRFDLSFDWTYLEQNPDWLTNYNTSPVSPDYSSPYVGDPLKEDSKYLTGKFTDENFALGKLAVTAFYNSIEKQSPFNTLSSVNSIVYYSGNRTSPTSPYNQSVLNSERAGINATVNSAVDWLRQGANLTWGIDYTYDHTTQELTDGTTVISPMTQNQIGAFAQLEVPVTDRLTLQGGARFDQFFLTVDDFVRPAAVQYRSSSAYTLWPAVNVTGGDFNYNSPTFNLGAVFDITEEAQAFANFSQGYSLTDIGSFTRRAGVNSLSEICAAYGALAAAYGCSGSPTYAINYASIAPEPQLVNSYEAGLRGDWGRFRGMVSAYLSTSENGVSYNVTTNQVSQQKELIWGVDASASADVLDNLTLGTVFSYVEGKYDADGDGEIEAGEYLPNNRIPNNYKINVFGEMRFMYDIMARAEVEYLSGRNVTSQDLPEVTLVNLGLSKDFGKSGKLSLAVRNVFDTSYVNPVASAVRGAEVPGLGRTIALTYRVTF